MKKLFAKIFLFPAIIFPSNKLLADYDSWGLNKKDFIYDHFVVKPSDPSIPYTDPNFIAGETTSVYELFQFNSKTGASNLVNTYHMCDESDAENYPNGPNFWKCNSSFNLNSSTFDPHDGVMNFVHTGNGVTDKKHVYNIEKNSWSIEDYTAPLTIDYDTTFDKSTIETNTNGSVSVGNNSSTLTIKDEINISSQGLTIGSNPLITKKDNGEIHIGKNSLITTEEEETLSDGRKVQPLYAKDNDGNKIPINIDGSKLLIDGIEVTAGSSRDSAQVTINKNNISNNTSNIKNLGEGVAGSTALTAALTALPQTSKESKLSCGVGSGAYSSRYAVGFGCASKVNQRVDVNAGGSYVFGGSKSYGEGTLDNGVIKAGFVFKLGELKKPTQISMKEKKIMETKIETLEEKNKQLLARLVRLEKIALGENKAKDLAVYSLR